MAVVVAGKLDDFHSAGKPSRQPHGAHCRLGAGADHPHFLDAGNGTDDQFGQMRFGLGRRAIAGAPRQRRFNRRHHAGVAMAEDHRPPGTDVVEVGVAVDIGEPLPLRLSKKNRLPAHRSKGAGGRINAAGNELARPGICGVATGASSGSGGGMCHVCHQSGVSGQRGTWQEGYA